MPNAFAAARHACRISSFAVAILGSAVGAIAQPPCHFAYAPGDALAGADGPVTVLVRWDPDGPGPAPLHIAVGGSFQVAGSVISPALALYEPVTRTWAAFPAAVPGNLVNAATAHPNGNLIVATNTGVHEWNGATWQQLANTAGQQIQALAVLPNGDVVAGGVFLTIAGLPINGLARWDGTTWHAMGAPQTVFSAGTVEELLVMPNGDLIAAGFFTQIGGVACHFLARWDGVAWHALGAGSSYIVFGLVATAAGELVASGTFATATGQVSVAKWTGTAWVEFAPGLPASPVQYLASFPNGDVLAYSSSLWISNGAPWTQYATSAPPANIALPVSATDVLAGGDFAPSATVPAQRLARWDGTAWSPPSAGTSDVVDSVAVTPDGGFLAGGKFSRIGGQVANRLAHFDGTAWTPIVSTAVNTVRYAVARPGGQVVLVGEFPNPTTGGTDLVVEWNGSQVVPIYAGLWGARLVRAVTRARNGDILLAYIDLGTVQPGIARWNGTTLTFHVQPVTGSLYALLELPNGDLLLGGGFQLGTYQSLAVWNGTTVALFGPPLNGSVTALALAPDGSVIVAGGFTSPMRIARGDGVTWQPLGAGLTDAVTSVVILPDGGVVAAERRSVGFSNPVWASRVHHWDGSAWTQLADTIGQANVAWSPAGTLALFGEFRQAGGAANAYFARLLPTCPALAQDLGGGCAGAAGQVVLHVRERAWLGGVLRTEAIGLPTAAAAIGVFGFTPTAQPLATLHPLGAPGCVLWTSDDILLQFAVGGGVVAPQIAVPSTPALVGGQFLHQVLGVELDATGDVAAITSSNVLLFTAGAL